MKCPITNKELKEDYQTLGWIGNDMLKIELTPQFAKFCLMNISKANAVTFEYIRHICPMVLNNHRRGFKTLVLENAYVEILKIMK